MRKSNFFRKISSVTLIFVLLAGIIGDFNVYIVSADNENNQNIDYSNIHSVDTESTISAENDGDQFEVTTQMIIDRFSTTELFIQQQLDAGYTLGNVFAVFITAQANNHTYEETLNQLFRRELNESQSVTGDVYDDLSNLAFGDILMYESEEATVSADVYDETKEPSMEVNEESNTENAQVNKEPDNQVSDVGDTDTPQKEQDPSDIDNGTGDQEGEESVEKNQIVDKDTLSNELQNLATTPPVLEKPPVYDKTSFNEAPYSIGINNESVSTLSGGLSLQGVDMSLPGRNGLSFSLSRQYDSNSSQFHDMDYGSATSSYDIFKYFVEYNGVQKPIITKYEANFKEQQWIQHDYNNNGIPDEDLPITDTIKKTLGSYSTRNQAEQAIGSRIEYTIPSQTKTAPTQTRIYKTLAQIQHSIYYSEGDYGGNLYKSGAPVESGVKIDPQTKYVNETCVNEIPGKYDAKGNWYATGSGNSCPASIQYINNGFTGKLTRNDTKATKTCAASGYPPNYVCTKKFTAYYGGYVTKPGTDTLQYTQKYTGTITKPSYKDNKRFDNWVYNGLFSWRYAYQPAGPGFVEEKYSEGTSENVVLRSIEYANVADANNLKSKMLSTPENSFIGSNGKVNYYTVRTPNPVVKQIRVASGTYTTYFNTTSTPLVQQLYPIGKGWSWNLPYIESKEGKQYVHLASGGSYEVEGNQLKGYDWEGFKFTTDTSVSVNGETSKYALTSIDGTQIQRFTNDGRILQIADLHNNKIDFHYEMNSTYNRKLLTRIKDAIGNTIQISYNVSTVTISKGNQSVVYNKRSEQGIELLESVIDTLGRKTAYSYSLSNAKFNLFESMPERMASNPYALLTKIQHPTGATTEYAYEKNPIRRSIGADSFNEVYRLGNRLDKIHFNNGQSEIYNRQTYSYNNSDFGSNYGVDHNFSTSVNNGQTTSTFYYKKDYIDSNTPAQYYLDRSEEQAEGIIKKSTYGYTKKVGNRSYPVTTPTSTIVSDNQTSDTLTTSIEFDNFGNVIRSVDPTGAVNTNTYDTERHLIKTELNQVDSNQFIYTEYTRNSKGNITKKISRKNSASGEILQQVTNDSYDSYGNVTSQTIFNGSSPTTIKTEYSTSYYNAFPTKQSVVITDANNVQKTVSIKSEYDILTGLASASVDGNENRTTYQYDNLGRVRQVTYPDSTIVRASYDDVQNTLTVTNELGAQSKTRWNALGLKVEDGIFTAEGYKKKKGHTYDGNGRLIWDEDALGNRTYYMYDNWNRQISTTYPDGSIAKNEYNDSLRKQKKTDGAGTIQINMFDKFGKLLKSEEKSSESSTPRTTNQFSYHPFSGKVLQQSDGNNNKTTFDYDLLGQLTSVTNAKGEITRYGYDSMGNLLRTTFPDGNHKDKVYDELNRVKLSKDESNNTEKLFYDSNHNLIKKIDLNGNSTSYVYDSRNRLKSRTGIDENVSFTYDATGKRLSMTDARGITSYQYNNFTSELLKVTYPDGLNLTLQYDENGNRKQLTEPFGRTFTYTYDKLSRMKTLGSDTWASIVEYSYLKNGLVGETSQNNGTYIQQKYDGYNLVGVDHIKRNDNTILNTHNYSYDNNGNIINRTEYGSTNVFTYDELNRISTSSENLEKYVYDQRGNRQVVESNLLPNNNKNLNKFDSQNRLKEVTTNGVTVQYRYNGDGLLVERVQGTETTRYYYDGNQIIAEATVINGSPELKARYIRGNQLEAIEYSDARKAYVLYNGHGDVTEIRDENGELLNQYSYDIWGNLLTKNEQVHNPFLYSGELWDNATNLQYLRARWYDPSVGRFISKDTYEGELNNPLSLNLYAYGANNPIRYIDPSGHCFTEWLGKEYCKAAWDAIKKDAIKSWENLKEIHSSWYTAADYWTMGTLTQLNDYYTINQENPYSFEQFLAAGFIVIDLTPGGKQAKLTDKGTSFIKNAIKGCNCFTAGTKVLTDEGEKNIEDIEVGDMVLAKDENNPDGELAYKEVTALYRNQRDDIIKLYVGEQIIETTDNHPFWVEGKGWVFADELQVGDKLQKADGSNLTIDKVEFVKLDKPVTVYNFTVADYHTYYVTDLGIWVHNTNCMFGANGVQTTSKTVWKEKGSKARLDVENPNPGQRPGQIHYQDANNKKYLFDSSKGKFVDSNGNLAPNSVNNKLGDPNFVKKLNVGLTQYLGENPI